MHPGFEENGDYYDPMNPSVGPNIKRLTQYDLQVLVTILKMKEFMRIVHPPRGYNDGIMFAQLIAPASPEFFEKNSPKNGVIKMEPDPLVDPKGPEVIKDDIPLPFILTTPQAKPWIIGPINPLGPGPENPFEDVRRDFIFKGGANFAP